MAAADERALARFAADSNRARAERMTDEQLSANIRTFQSSDPDSPNGRAVEACRLERARRYPFTENGRLYRLEREDDGTEQIRWAP